MRSHSSVSEDAIQVEDIYRNAPNEKNLLIVGNTPSAIEAATVLSKTNNVSLLAEGDILPTFERQLVKLVERALSKNIKIRTELTDEDSFDQIILATHREPQTNTLQLEHANVQCTDGYISIDASCQTSNPKIYAVGECADCNHSAALAIAQGRVAAESACGIDAHLDSNLRSASRLVIT